ncbi:TRAP-type C4-dicarboxylate transport system permease small subunit [Prauserella shujinwangii]|uniref:TRAP-type C4-dicarboxylate transport system permease small subunit n=1 Tax=Prauserella shujinwangii TaxID=1453103 RepID=A0A2T0M1D5_9PSEU|nr:TRAP transporter small permease [Prauserella shujinwangii]PRX50393.1 TRAP-type C4-dicarboxylate transport system permease small subunit [Prauserella shujinwangii]
MREPGESGAPDHERPGATTGERSPSRREPTPLRWLSRAEAVVGGLLLATILGLMLLQAAQRYLPASGWVWTGELARFSLVWLTFAMSGYLLGRDGHVTLKLVDQVTGGVVRRLVHIFADGMVAVVCLNLAYEAFELVASPSRQTTPALGMPVGYFYVIPLAGLVLTTVRSVVAVFRPRPVSGEERSA